jgi:alanine racemase
VDPAQWVGRDFNPHPTWLEIDRAAIRANCAHIITDTGTPLMAVVKGVAYGHGAVETARAAAAGGAGQRGKNHYRKHPNHHQAFYFHCFPISESEST